MKKLKTKSSINEILSIVFNVSPLYASLILVQRLIYGLIPSIQVLVTSWFINIVLDVAAGKMPRDAVFLPLGGIIATLAYSMLTDKLLYFAQVRFTNLMRSRLSVQLVDKYGSLAYKHLENPDTRDLISRVYKDPEKEILNAYNNLVNFGSLVITVLGIMTILLTQVWWTGILITAISIPLVRLAIKSGQANYQANRETTKYTRKYTYIGKLLTQRENIEERSLFGYGDQLNERWEENYEKARKIIFRTELKWFLKMKSGALITSLISLFIIIALLPFVLSEAITVGMFISLVNATFSLVKRMSTELTYLMDELARNVEFIKDIQKYRLLEEAKGALTKPTTERPQLKTLEFKNVSFKYPNTDKYILNNLSFMIKDGKHYAIVGLNGAGKTTITKLITGLYRNFEGEILINGRSILEYPQQELKALCAVAYQDFMRYSISLKENIALGDVNNIGHNDLAINEAIQTMDLQDLVTELPDGMKTKLGKIRKNGVDLSGGQWQRVALARFIVNPAPLRILDEPTAAIDPVSESRMYEKFEQLCKGQTTIFISHRLGSTLLADEILVIDQGKLIENGSHDELMNYNGVYSKLYESQRCWYQ